jgi:Helix-turn-helix domain
MHVRRQLRQRNVRPFNAVRRPLHYPSPIRVQYLTGILNAPIVSIVIWSEAMGDRKYLTADEVAQRYRGAVSVGTLRNWRAMRVGPPFVKIGRAVLYPVDELDAWDKRNMVSCRGSGRLTMTNSDQA